MARKSKRDEAQDQTQRYLVGADALGEWQRGETVHEDELPLREDGSVDQDNIDRLLGLGALVAVEEQPFPSTVVPVVMTLAEAVRTDSPPTLPIVPASVATTPAELAEAVNPDNTVVTGPLPEAR